MTIEIIADTAQKIGSSLLDADATQFNDFLEIIAPGDSALHFRTFDDNKSRKDSALAKKPTGALNDVYAQLKALNDKGAGAFMVINSGGQKAADITKVRAVFADTDGAELETLLVLKPHMVIESSSGNYHAYWRVDDDFKLDSFTPIQLAIAAKYGTDSKVNDLSRVMRVPGFNHNKGKPFATRIERMDKALPPYSHDEIVSGLGLIIGVGKTAPLAAPASESIIGNVLNSPAAPFSFSETIACEFLSAAQAAYPDGLPTRAEFCDFGFVCATLVVVENWPEPEARKILDEIASKPAGADQSNNDSEWDSYLKSTRKKVENGERVVSYRSMFKKARDNGWQPQQAPPLDWVDEMNANYFVAPYANTAVVFSKAADVWSPLKTDAFKLLLANKTVEVTTQRGPTMQPMADAWLKHPKRNQYNGVGFWPETHAPVGMFNLWQGWPIPPVCGVVTPALKHIQEVICDGDVDLYDWVIGWCAYAVQYPNEQGHTALVIVGGRGTGKTVFADWMKSIFGRYSMSVASGKLLTGDFTGHLEKCVMMVAEEAFWAGDKAAENSLKHVITGNTLSIHPKGFAPYDAPNHMHVIMTSNEYWVVPAGVDERRFTVCEVSDKYKRNDIYFKGLAQWVANGGIAALLDYLLKYNLKGFNVRNPPDTAALRDQKLLSLDPAVRWILYRLEAGGFMDKGWEVEVSAQSVTDRFCNHQNLATHERRRAETSLGIALKKIFPGIDKVRRRNSVRKETIYQLPHNNIDDARRAFEDFAGLQGYNWGDDSGIPDTPNTKVLSNVWPAATRTGTGLD